VRKKPPYINYPPYWKQTNKPPSRPSMDLLLLFYFHPTSPLRLHVFLLLHILFYATTWDTRTHEYLLAVFLHQKNLNDLQMQPNSILHLTWTHVGCVATVTHTMIFVFCDCGIIILNGVGIVWYWYPTYYNRSTLRGYFWVTKEQKCLGRVGRNPILMWDYITPPYPTYRSFPRQTTCAYVCTFTKAKFTG
jgi:hypothetical protein